MALPLHSCGLGLRLEAFLALFQEFVLGVVSCEQ